MYICMCIIYIYMYKFAMKRREERRLETRLCEGAVFGKLINGESRRAGGERGGLEGSQRMVGRCL